MNTIKRAIHGVKSVFSGNLWISGTRAVRSRVQTRALSTGDFILPIRPSRIQIPERYRLVDINLRTLCPYKLTREDYVNLSNSRAFTADRELPVEAAPRSGRQSDSLRREAAGLNRPLNHQRCYINYEVRLLPLWHETRPQQCVPFPNNTRGFFYYRQPPRIPTAGSIRFRVTQSDDPRSFRQGVDLLNEHGLPWQIPLAGIADSAHHQILLKILARDALVSPEVMTKAASLSKDFIRKNRRSLGPNAQVVHELFEPFYVDLAKPDGAVFVVGDETIFSALTRELFCVRLNDDQCDWWPYERGQLVCNFVPIKSYTNVGVFVQRIIEPVRVRPDRPAVPPGVQLRLTEIHPGKKLTRGAYNQLAFYSRMDLGAESVKQSLLTRAQSLKEKRTRARSLASRSRIADKFP